MEEAGRVARHGKEAMRLEMTCPVMGCHIRIPHNHGLIDRLEEGMSTGSFSSVPLYDPLAVYEKNGIRLFTNSRLQDEMATALAEMHPDDTVAVVAHHVYDQNGGAIENVTKLSIIVRDPLGLKGLSVMAGGFKDWKSGEIGAEGKIVFLR